MNRTKMKNMKGIEDPVLVFSALLATVSIVAVVQRGFLNAQRIKTEHLQMEVDDLESEVEFWKHKACFHSKAPPKECEK